MAGLQILGEDGEQSGEVGHLAIGQRGKQPLFVREMGGDQFVGQGDSCGGESDPAPAAVVGGDLSCDEPLVQ